MLDEGTMIALGTLTLRREFSQVLSHAFEIEVQDPEQRRTRNDLGQRSGKQFRDCRDMGAGDHRERKFEQTKETEVR
jgi:hypothetical protein